MLTSSACHVIYSQGEASLIDAYTVLISNAQQQEFPENPFPNPLLKSRLQFVQTIILKALEKPVESNVSRDTIELILMDMTFATEASINLKKSFLTDHANKLLQEIASEGNFNSASSEQIGSILRLIQMEYND